ncbi:chemotaxis protein CheA [uncultured Sphingomonas sp.]|uniref:chemotaxis protein CheA n=1 Tax=uncultured Sphingomonas sp. TaxID=158754 RepID=UPI0035CB6287
MDELLQEFIAETRETLDAISGEIVAWEAAPADKARLDAIFRFVHTVKGSCGFLDLPRLARLSHAAEDVLAAVRLGERWPDTATVDAVLAIIDRIGEIVEAIDAGLTLDDTGDDLLIAALDGKGPMPGPVPEDAPRPAGKPGAVAPSARAVTRSVRLNVDLLDRMMSGMSDMVLARNELARKLRDDADPRLEAALERLSASVVDMRETVTRTRMQTIDALFSPLPRMVRDTAASLGKTVSLAIDGSDVELDREMVEVMRDPLVHLIRNAIDHGIESPAERRLAGKPDAGRLVVSARQSGNQIIIDIADDGRGIDTDRLVAKLSAQPGQDAAALRQLTEAARLELIFHPGLSSKDEATAISGRGVGMDVVRANVEQVGGRIELANAPGRGLTVGIHVPLTLSIIPAVIVGIAGQRFAIPRQTIGEIVTTQGEKIRVQQLGDAQVATVRDRRMPLIDLGITLGLAAAERRMLVVLDLRGGSYALGVDTVFDTEELVVKPSAPSVMAVGIYAGQTLPDSGLPMLLLDAGGIAEKAGLVFAPEVPQPATIEAEQARGVEALLFVDLNGERRAIPLAMVDRIQQVPTETIRRSGGRLRMTVDGGTVPIVATGAIGDRALVAVLRLHDDRSGLGYAIGEALDIVTLPPVLAPAAAPGIVAGVAVIDGDQIEVVDPFWIFADAAAGAAAIPSPADAAPLCLLQPDAGGWLEGFLRPMLEGAGYRVATQGAAGEVADIALVLDGEPAWAAAAGAPLLTLARDPGGSGGAVYRYDRAGVLAAIAQRLGRAA